MCWFHALRITSLSRKLNLPSFRPRIVFSAVTNRSSRTTEGFANPASLQSEMTASSGPDAVADVIRQISTSCRKSSKTRTGRGLLNAPEVNGNRQMKISPNTPVASNSCHKRRLPVKLFISTCSPQRVFGVIRCKNDNPRTPRLGKFLGDFLRDCDHRLLAEFSCELHRTHVRSVLSRTINVN